MRADLDTTNHGTIISIRPRTEVGRLWMACHVPDSHTNPERAVDCEHRCGIAILMAAIGAGLKLRDTTTGKIAQGEPA
jgi:hypothetical protein